ncbi:hypothetical protein PAPYR_10659 [Paratrimastix pyriformis]|uniref:Uncharacterized protein n=1 Tax=Paratrimastix pyriformis TaxID=342808 RepID=A0ABQ8UAE4_9EUKA|nr:hypothetical protein PAPYR_10659 [Paratrimastix pyriformis]
MEICSENDDLDGDVSNFVMTHAEIKRNDDPFMRFLNRDISEKHLRYTDLDSDFKVLTQKMLPELAKLFGYITVHKQQVVSRALLKTIVEMLGSLEREMLVSSMTDFFYQVFGSVTWHAGQSDLESISSESRSAHSNCVLVLPSCMHIAEENHLSDFQAHFLKEHAQCGKREVFLEFFNRAEEDLVFHDLDHISTFKNSMLDEFCKLFGHLGFSSGALPSSTLLKGIIESLQKGCSPAVSRDRIAVWIQKLLKFSYAYPSAWWGTGTCPFPVSLII